MYVTGVPLSAYLVLALVLFCIGLYGALTKRNAVIVLISIELMLNAANINLVAFSKFGVTPSITGQRVFLISENFRDCCSGGSCRAGHTNVPLSQS